MATKKSSVKANDLFEVTEEFLEATEGQQDKAIKAFIAANPKAQIEPNEAGQTAPFLRRQSGKRFDISERINQGGDAKEILKYAREKGGSERDISAHIAGGFSRTSKFYGTSYITLRAA